MLAPTYEVRVAGLVPQEALAGLSDVHIAQQELRTVLTGSFKDQAELHGFLHRLRALGLELIEVRSLPDPDDLPGSDDLPDPDDRGAPS
jgi:hypothetical protein